MTDFTATRRLMLAGALGAGAAALGGVARAQYIASGVTRTVKTTNGPVVGLVENGVSTFKGLRYGAPPVGPLRWAPPARPKPWTDPALAAQFGASAIQLSSGGSAVRYPGTVGPALNQLMTSGEDITRQSEDCLFLNLWTPALDNKARPVMVWFHGGGFNYGSGNWPVYNGHNLAKNHDVVLVSVTHRLNAFGYLHLADLGGDAASGNAGMLDLIASLQWVHDNIAAFGGDPGNVTIFGQSGGGAKVSTMQAMPAAKGLRHKGIVQSGAALRSGDKDRATEQARAIMKAMGGLDIAAMREAPASAIMAAARTAGPIGGRWGPVMDGVALTGHPFDPIANPAGADVPIMVGCTSDEQTLYNVGFDWWGKQTEAQMIERLMAQYGPLTDKLVAAAKAAEGQPQLPLYGHHLQGGLRLIRGAGRAQGGAGAAGLSLRLGVGFARGQRHDARAPHDGDSLRLRQRRQGPDPAWDRTLDRGAGQADLGRVGRLRPHRRSQCAEVAASPLAEIRSGCPRHDDLQHQKPRGERPLRRVPQTDARDASGLDSAPPRRTP